MIKYMIPLLICGLFLVEISTEKIPGGLFCQSVTSDIIPSENIFSLVDLTLCLESPENQISVFKPSSIEQSGDLFASIGLNKLEWNIYDFLVRNQTNTPIDLARIFFSGLRHQHGQVL